MVRAEDLVIASDNVNEADLDADESTDSALHRLRG